MLEREAAASGRNRTKDILETETKFSEKEEWANGDCPSCAEKNVSLCKTGL